jgi:isopentenyl-diphosphate Delta-isomerase
MESKTRIQNRKTDHIRINLEEDVLSGVTTGLEAFSLEHNALPEMDLKDVDTTCRFLEFTIRFPLLISSMTGGNDESEKINRHLAEAAQQTGVALGLGSQRPMLENPALITSYKIRQCAKDIPIFGNIGAVQFNHGLSIEDCKRLVDEIEADGLILHLNPLQEALQPEGEKDFSGLLSKIEKLCNSVKFPILVKEVGWGISAMTAKQLIDAGVSVLDTAGAGGTSWSQVEANRITEERQKQIAFEFRQWGIPTAESIRQIRSINKKIPVIASGGIRNGIEAAKCVALGANLCGMAGRLLRAGAKSTETAIAEINEIEEEMRIAMFASGHRNLLSLSKSKLIEVRARK